jgi:tetratricopeptide (TPR) repeat protein
MELLAECLAPMEHDSSGGVQRAAELAHKALALDDSNTDALALLSAIDWVQGRFDEAAGDAERAVAINPPRFALSGLFIPVQARFDQRGFRGEGLRVEAQRPYDPLETESTAAFDRLMHWRATQRKRRPRDSSP